MMPDLKMAQQVILVIGDMGGDGGYTVLTPHGLVHVPGNNPMAQEAAEGLMKSFTALQEIASKEAMGGMAAGAAQMAPPQM
jgi:hypothetical protein